MTIALFEPLTKPTAAQLNAIGASQTRIAAVYLGTTIQPAIKWCGSIDIEVLRHTHRWLIYNSTGELVDLSGANDPVSLPDPPSGMGIKDLDEIDWLVIGMFYRVTGCETAAEYREAPSA